ncbi:rhomboid family intramembrane serine protease [Metabacillus niabensis]|uniref:rhomboid family intramembrane serine protease n=1 Tax=Metabacillus niabensis TaxID=324854 RepID=UPI001CFAD574|nr:rhomboid family intramembrane serine protease [Metabacillus niabensis]
MFTRSENFRTFLQLYPVVSVLVCIHILFWLLLQIPIPQLKILLGLLEGYNAGIANGEYWRLITPIFLHIGFAHLFFNSISLILFAPALERMLGKAKFILIYIVSGMVANIATYIIEPLQYSHLGASGAIFGILGVYLFIIVYRKGLIDQANSQMIISILVIGLVMTFFNSNINVVAHIFGMIGGFIFAPFVIRKRAQFSHQSFYNPNYSRTKFSLNFSPKHIIWILFSILIFLGLIFRLS